nr:hypothetical protein GCM10020092_051120 [Actinoplanes digitatis]
MNVLVKAYCHSSKVSGTARCRFAGLLSTGNVDFTWVSGTTRTPSVGAEFIATPSRAEAVVEQDLGEGAADRVADDDRRGVEAADDLLVVGDDLRNGQVEDRCRVGVERLHLHLEAGVAGRDDAQALALVVGDPVFPAARGDPESVYEHDRVGCHVEHPFGTEVERVA